MNKTKKSFGNMKKKLMGAVCMLLVASIMMISATYAWFTLSTAPEITGITTSVGANGNLEMALLSGNVDATTTQEGGVGSSMAIVKDTVANLTWGNLVDLSDDSYGLQSISLKPARFNNAGSWATGNLLSIPVYGADGRVKDLKNDTQASGKYNADNNTWENVNPMPVGVRAIGANDNLTAQQSGLMSAKAAYNSKISEAQSTIRQALSNNAQGLANAVTQLAMSSSDAPITAENEAAINNMITATENSLKLIDEAYKQAILAAATTIDTDAGYKAAVAAVNGAASANAALTAAQDSGITIPAQIETAVNNLEAQKTTVATAKNNADYKAKLTALINTEKVTVNGYNAKATGDPATDLMVGEGGSKEINPTFMGKMTKDGGVRVEMPDGSGVFAYIATVVGNYSAASEISISFKGLTVTNMPSTMITTATVDPTMGNVLQAVQAAGTSAGATTTLSDTYGYMIDLAFRTNAVNSYLQLQTEGKQRVYSDSESAATQGAGSSMTFKAVTNAQGNSLLTDDAVKNLMKSIRVTFLDPDGNSSQLAVLDMSTAKATADGIKADLKLGNYVDGNFVPVANADSTEYNDSITLAKLNQNQAQRLSVVVWLDGDTVDNGDVANAAQSITGSMNLQFSSSVELQPMRNTALNNLKVDYGEAKDANGFYDATTSIYKVLNGNHIYKPDANHTYFSSDEANYTRLTSRTADQALALVTGEIVGGKTSVDSGSTTNLTASLANADIKSVAWSAEGGTVSADNGTSVTFTAPTIAAGEAAGTATVTAVITFNIGTESVPIDKTVTATWTVTVNAAAASNP